MASETGQIDRSSDEIIYALARRIIAYRLRDFDRVCDSANEICDRYEIKKAG